MAKLTAKYTKAQFLASRQRPGIERDILAAVLKDGESYTIAEVEKLKDEFLKKEVG